MGTLKVDVDDDLIKRFKEKARRQYGKKRGSIKQATVDLIKKWVNQDQVDWESLRGTIESENSSIKQEKQGWKKID